MKRKVCAVDSPIRLLLTKRLAPSHSCQVKPEKKVHRRQSSSKEKASSPTHSSSTYSGPTHPKQERY